MADLAPGALRQGLRHAAGSIGAAVQATSGAAAAAARLNLLYEGYSGKEIGTLPPNYSMNRHCPDEPRTERVPGLVSSAASV